jgi:hypothetical protein
VARGVRAIVVAGVVLACAGLAQAGSLYGEARSAGWDVDGTRIRSNGAYVRDDQALTFSRESRGTSIGDGWMRVALVDQAPSFGGANLWRQTDYADIRIHEGLFSPGSNRFHAFGDRLTVEAFKRDGRYFVRMWDNDKYCDTPPIPEPNAAAVFGLGAVLVGAVLLRRRA